MSASVFSVIIPSYLAKETIEACLRSLRHQDFHLPYDVTVVDSSPDDTGACIGAQFPEANLILLEHRTDPAQARNLGAGQADSEYLAFIDADCIAPPDWLSRLYAGLQDGYDAVGGAITNANGESRVSWAGYFLEFREFLPEGLPRRALNLTLGNAAYQRKLFWAVGGFPVGWFPQEDQVFHARFVQAGGRILFDPRIQVAHYHRSKLGTFLDHQRRIGRANARVVQQLGLPGARLARQPAAARWALPGLVLLRFIRTMASCRKAEGGLLFRRPGVAMMCLWGLAWWGQGFVEGAQEAARLRKSIRAKTSD